MIRQHSSTKYSEKWRGYITIYWAFQHQQSENFGPDPRNDDLVFISVISVEIGSGNGLDQHNNRREKI